MEIQFGERVGHRGWLLGPKLFRPEAFPACASSKLSEFIYLHACHSWKCHTNVWLGSWALASWLRPRGRKIELVAAVCQTNILIIAEWEENCSTWSSNTWVLVCTVVRCFPFVSPLIICKKNCWDKSFVRKSSLRNLLHNGSIKTHTERIKPNATSKLFNSQKLASNSYVSQENIEDIQLR